MKYLILTTIFASIIGMSANCGNVQKDKVQSMVEEKTNQSHLIEETEVHDSGELINQQSNTPIEVLSTSSVNNYNIVSKNLNTGVLNFIDFDDYYYTYRQFAFDDNSASTYSINNQIINNKIINNETKKIDNADGTISLYTEGFNPNDIVSSAGIPIYTTGIIGSDDRKPVEDTLEWPYRASGYISIRYDVVNNETGKIDSRYYMSTGFLEGPDLMVTAGHSVYGDVTQSYTDSNGNIHTEYEDNLNNPRFPDEIIYYPAQNGAVKPYGGIKVERVYIEKSYYLNTLKDWACCKLSSPIGYQTGWRGKISYFYQENYPFTSHGYPGSKGGVMYEGSGRLTYFEAAENGWYYRTDLDTEGGQSGSAYNVTVNGNNYVCGIHTYTVGDVYTGGIRIDGFMFSFMNSFVTSSHNIHTITPSDYGYRNVYPSDEKTENEYVDHNVDNLEFKTRRFRTGYIQGEYIVMSPIKTGYTKAFIEYRFVEPVRRIDVELTHWRERSYEWLDSSTGRAELQILNDDFEWKEKLDLLEDIDLSRDRTMPETYTIVFDKPIYRFRFYSEIYSPRSTSDNRGRICIGDMTVWCSKNYDYLPLSGSELVFDADLWSGVVSDNNNCYNYALNNQVDTRSNELWKKQQPGEYAGIYNNVFTKERLVSAVQADFEKYNSDNGTNLIFKEVGRDEKCPPGTYKVALAAYSWDYHWYRQDADGYWSHKPGTTPVRLRDNSGNLILDPATADRGNYVNFLGYFAVSPWGNLYA